MQKLALLVYPEFSLQEVMNLSRLFRWHCDIMTEVVASTLRPVRSEEGILVQPQVDIRSFRQAEVVCPVAATSPRSPGTSRCWPSSAPCALDPCPLGPSAQGRCCWPVQGSCAGGNTPPPSSRRYSTSAPSWSGKTLGLRRWW